jgi:hypothetical protein
MDIIPSKIINEIILVLSGLDRYYANQICKSWHRICKHYIKVISDDEDVANVRKPNDILSIDQQHILSVLHSFQELSETPIIVTFFIMSRLYI